MKKSFIFSFALVVATLYSHCQIDSIESVNIDEITITGTRNETETRNLPVTISIINQEKLQEENNQNIIPVVSQNVPGVFVTDRGILGYGVSTNSSGSIKIRGIGGMANMLVLIDGLPQYAGLYGHPIADVYQTMMAERVEVLRGPASMIYGSNAMGGVMNIVTRKMQMNGMHTHINYQMGSYGTLETSVVNRFRQNKFFSVVGLNFGSTNGHRDNMDFNQYSTFVKLGYDISDYWQLNADVNVSHFNSDNPGEVNNPIFDNVMHVTRGAAAINLTNNYAKSSGAVRVFYNWGHHKINNGYYIGESPQTSWYKHNDLMGGASIYESFYLFEGNTITIGADYQIFGGRAWNELMSNGKQTTIIDTNQSEVAGYVDVRQNLFSWLILDAGVRVDNHSQAGTQIIPQGGFTLLFPKNLEIRGIVGKGFRNPTIREMYMYRPANSELKAEELMNYELSFKQRLLGDRLRYALNVFYLKASNLIETAMISGKPLNINTGEIENWGIEGEISYSPCTQLRFNTNYSFLNMKNPILAAPEHKLYIGGNYKFYRFSIVTGMQYIGGLSTQVTPIEIKEDFILWNANVDFQLSKEIHLFAKIDNILNQEYEINYGFPMPKTTLMVGVRISN